MQLRFSYLELGHKVCMCACVGVQAFTTLHFVIRRPGLVCWNECKHCDSKRIK